MRNIRLSPCALPLAASLSLITLPGFAADPAGLGPVEVSGKQQSSAEVRTDVHTACKQIDLSLQEIVGAAFARYGITGSTRVDFELVGNTVRSVRTSTAMRDYRPYLSRAMRDAECSDAGAAGASSPSRYAFILDVRPEDSSGTEPRVALRSLSTTTLAVAAR